MPTIIILGAFMLVMSLAASILLNSTGNSRALSEALQADMNRFYTDVERVINDDLTPERLQALGPGQTTFDQLLNSDMRYLARGRWGDATLDAWGRPLTLRMFTQSFAFGPQASAPVTGFLMASAGPNGVLETTVPAQSAITTLTQIFSVIVPAGSDDIVASFSNETGQRRTFNALVKNLNLIATGAREEYQRRLLIYRDSYQAYLNANPAAPTQTMADRIRSDPAAPQYLQLSLRAQREPLGLENLFSELERLLPNGGQFQVSSAPLTGEPDMRTGAQILLGNSLNATPWPVMSISVNIKEDL